MYLYSKVYSDGLYEGQELGVEQHIFQPSKGLELVLHKGDLSKWGEGNLQFEIQITDFDETSVTFKPYYRRKNKYGKEVKITLGKKKKCSVECVYIYDGGKHYSTDEIYFYLDTIDCLFDVTKYRDEDIYVELFEKFPEYKETLLPKILSEGNIYLIKHIYERSLFGIEKDELRIFSLLVSERDYDEFKRWYNLPKTQEDIKRMDSVVPNEELMSFKAEYNYWIGRYFKDHHNSECLESYERPLKFFIRDGYYDNIPYTQFLTARDVVEYVVDENKYKKYDKLELEYTHGFTDEPLTLWIVYGCYLAAKEKEEKGENVTLNDIYLDVPDEEYERARNISWATPRKYIDKDFALAYVKDAIKKGDKYAKALLKHYGIGE